MGSVFAGDLKEATTGAEDLAGPERTTEMIELLDQAQVMKHFDSMDFRNALLMAFQHATTGSTEGMEQAYEQLTEPQREVIEEFSSDFNQLAYSDERRQRIIDEVNSQIAAGQLGKALKVVRSNDSAYPSIDSLTMRERVWTEVAKFDNRFEAVAEAYRNKITELQS